MELGGIRSSGADKLFLISTTHGAETIGLAAMIATIDEFERHGMIESNWERGEDLRGRLNNVIAHHGLGNALEVKGEACLFALICRNAQGVPDDAYRTLMMQEMIARGVLFQGLFYTTWSHQDAELDEIVAAFDESSAIYRQAIESGSCSEYLIGPPARPVFRKRI